MTTNFDPFFVVSVFRIFNKVSHVGKISHCCHQRKFSKAWRRTRQHIKATSAKLAHFITADVGAQQGSFLRTLPKNALLLDNFKRLFSLLYNQYIK